MDLKGPSVVCVCVLSKVDRDWEAHEFVSHSLSLSTSQVICIKNARAGTNYQVVAAVAAARVPKNVQSLF